MEAMEPLGDEPQSFIFAGSTAVDRATFDPTTGKLRVTFTSGRKWLYQHVSDAVWRAFISSGSPGSYVQHSLVNFISGEIFQ